MWRCLELEQTLIAIDNCDQWSEFSVSAAVILSTCWAAGTVQPLQRGEFVCQIDNR